MSPWVIQLTVGLSCTLVGGIILAIFKLKLDESAEKNKKIEELATDKISQELVNLKNRLTSIEISQKETGAKTDFIALSVQKLETKVEIIFVEQRHMNENIMQARKEIEKSNAAIADLKSDYGKVIRKS